MTAASNEVVAVIQADRDWAADAMKAADICGSGSLANVRSGRWDENAYVQAFARHRIAHSDPRPVAEGLREAVLEARGWFGPVTSDEMRIALANLDAALATHSPAPMAGEGE
jgi:hypothetical protein